MPEVRSTSPLVWIDCEMTGLDPSTDTVMSIACFVTDYKLNLLESEGFHAIIHHSEEQLSRMGEWCTRQHGASGLTADCIASSTTPDQAAQGLLQYVQTYISKPRQALLAGNSVHADKMFLSKEPYAIVMQHLHHRILDVSAIKEAARRWAPENTLAETPQKEGKHEAKADIFESIAEARFYRDKFFVQAG